jgi:deazaflavin-dependent oxidoreductase (nitroreductase family)
MERTVKAQAHQWITAIGARILGTRCFVHAPIWIYKAGAGNVLGNRLVMLEHIGRKSGSRRHVVLEVFSHRSPDVYVVASGHGERSQWLRNLGVNPRVRLYVAASAPIGATARRLGQQEADREQAAYQARHPRLWAAFKPVLEETLGSTISDTNTQLPMVELRLDPPTPE